MAGGESGGAASLEGSDARQGEEREKKKTQQQKTSFLLFCNGF